MVVVHQGLEATCSGLGLVRYKFCTPFLEGYLIDSMIGAVGIGRGDEQLVQRERGMLGEINI